MTKKTTSFKLVAQDKTGELLLNQITYLGDGTYRCELNVNSNGFMCQREFGFDNDEFFLAKIHDVMISQPHSRAELTNLQTDNYIRFEPFGQDTILTSGFITEVNNVTQSIEFAFTVTVDALKTFVTAFEKMVRANI